MGREKEEERRENQVGKVASHHSGMKGERRQRNRPRDVAL